MYIICPKCKTQFTVTVQQIDFFSKVKCSQCKYIWTHKNNVKPNLDLKLPAIIKNNGPQYINWMPIVFLLIIYTFFFMLFSNQEYKLPQKSKLIIENINTEYDNEDKNLQIICKLQNLTNYVQKTKLVKIEVFDKNSNLLQSYIINQYRNHKIKPKNDLIIFISIDNVIVEANYIKISLCNALDYLIK